MPQTDTRRRQRRGTIDSHKLGDVLGTFIGGWHLVWAMLVQMGWAQPVIEPSPAMERGGSAGVAARRRRGR